MDRIVCVPFFFTGTLTGNQTRKIAFGKPARLVSWTAFESGADGDATLAFAGGGNHSIAAQAIRNSDGVTKFVPAPSDVPTIAADELVTMTLDYDGAAGTAAANVYVYAEFAVGVN